MRCCAGFSFFSHERGKCSGLAGRAHLAGAGGAADEAEGGGALLHAVGGAGDDRDGEVAVGQGEVVAEGAVRAEADPLTPRRRSPFSPFPVRRARKQIPNQKYLQLWACGVMAVVGSNKPLKNS